MTDAIEVGGRWRCRQGSRFEVEVTAVWNSLVAYRVPVSGSVCTTREQDFRDFYTPLDEPAPSEAPAHYESDVEPLVAIRAWGLNFALGCVVKHVARAGRKGPRLDDLIKARAYLDDEIAAEKGAAK